MKKYQSLVLSPLVSVLFLSVLFLPLAAPSFAATEVIQNGASDGALRVAVQDSGKMGVWRCGAASCGEIGDSSGWVQQIYGAYMKHSIVFLDGYNFSLRFTSGYGLNMAPPYWADESNTNNGDNSITTTYLADRRNVRITQTTSIQPGDNYYKMRWDIENIGETSQTIYNNLRFVHGEDTFLAGKDFGEGHFDNTQQMVYISNVKDGIADMMGIYADLATPFARYFEGKFDANSIRMREWILDNTVNPGYSDTGYSLGWERDSLAPGETWTIIAYEKFMRSKGVLVVAPAGQADGPGTTVSYPFIVQNLNVFTEDITLWVSGNAWPATILNASGNAISRVNIPAGGQAIVSVHVTIPLTVAAGDTDPVTLNGATGSYSGSDTTTTTASSGGSGPESGDLAPHDGFRGNGMCGIIVGPDENKTPGVATGAGLTAIYFAILLAPVALLKWRSRAGKQGRANRPWPYGEANSGQNGQKREEETKE